MPFHEELRAANRAAWDAMQEHPFVRAIAENQLGRDAFVRYLAYEGHFVSNAVEIFGHGLVKAPRFAAQRHLIGVLHALATEQVPYFERTFAMLGAYRPAPETFPPAVGAFCAGMLSIAREGSYAEIITAMLAAEWMYAEWCRRALLQGLVDGFEAEWIGLHTAPDFTDGVFWLKREIDQQAVEADPEMTGLLARRFGEVLNLEIEFHLAPIAPARQHEAGAHGGRNAGGGTATSRLMPSGMIPTKP